MFHESKCPACGDPADYCQGHGMIADPYGWGVLRAHDNGHHADCDPRGCSEWRHEARPCHALRDADTGCVIRRAVAV